MAAYKLLCLLLVTAALAESNSGSFLGRSRATATQKEAEGRLGKHAERLAQALQSEYGDLSGPSVADLVRARLAQEAAALAVQDSVGASIFNDYAQRTPISVLIVPRGALQGLAYAPYRSRSPRGAQLGFAATDMWAPPLMRGSSMEATESIMESDGSGNTIVRTMHCKDGNCIKSSKAVKANAGADEKLQTDNVLVNKEAQRQNLSQGLAQQRQTDENFMNMQDASTSISNAVQRMAQDMQSIHDSFGEDALDTMFNNIFSQEDMRQEANSTVAEETFSESTVVENGQVVRESKTCKNGQCSTKREVLNVADVPDERHVKEPSHKATMPF
mmetsp:Transcript_19596/g.45576  ORF Transcript_19596/g.45576 Transcript_19596/m.45576 type:complete len:331 (-) Transcript_19596:102-1094(-)|eukprot:CAMPEP_0178423562 /NCGR_PEP_ID=MMETSP0689_2-20121128/27752_1 /TAXON_ID=160604 /ORGANISM="Amphidinium massartii, Strain CS-259" /LENGTH=330 /DNA_ID=CAMNT_0020045159 /DNA_START=95 /DNA_END=1087 /DNA_ORIENTATION=-